MEHLSMLWSKYWGSRKKLQTILFPENEIVSPPYLRKVSRISHATFVNLHPTNFAVAVAPDGRVINLKGGYNMLTPGYYSIYYVDKRNRVNHIPRTAETTLDGFQVAMELVISYRVIDPIRALEVQNPVDTLLLFIQANLKEFIRSHTYEQIMGDLDGRKIDNEQVDRYIRERYIDRSPLAKLFYIVDVVVKERIGDPKVIELREKFNITQKQLDYRRVLQTINQELEKKVADQEALINQIKANSEVAQWNTLYQTKLQEREVSNKWGSSPAVGTDFSAPNDLLRIKVPLPEFLTSSDLFASVPQQFHAIEYVYSILAIVGSGDARTIDDLVESLRFGQEVTESSLEQLLANVNVEPLRIASFHYGTPILSSLLGMAPILGPLSNLLKDLTWRGKSEKKLADEDLKIKQADAQKAQLESQNLVIVQQLDNEKKALENENRRLELKKQQTEIIEKQIDILLKLSQLNLEADKKAVITTAVESQIPLLSSNPITPLLGSEIREPYPRQADEHTKSDTDTLSNTLLDLLSKKTDQ
jgi:hypothetical protein